MATISDLVSKRDGVKDAYFSDPRGFNDERRIEFRFADGDRLSLPYSHLVDVVFERKRADFPDSDVVSLDYTGYWLIMIVGSNLLSLYAAVHHHDISWIRDAGANELPLTSMPFVRRINLLKLTDATAIYRRLQDRRLTPVLNEHSE